jgi:nicotinate-nucleotide adenylyltransferase
VGGATLGAGLSANPAPAGVPIVAGSAGVFGGTFDPVHMGHLAVAQEAADALGLERVLFVPAGEPPHKPGRTITAARHRRAMVELAIADNNRFALDTIELDRAGPSYTADTLEALSPRYAALTLILSADAFLALHEWHDPRRILSLARVAVAPREGYPAAGPDYLAGHFPDLADRVVFLSGPQIRLSASDLRRTAARGRTLRYLVPNAVAAYIDDHDLYRLPRRNPEP